MSRHYPILPETRRHLEAAVLAALLDNPMALEGWTEPELSPAAAVISAIIRNQPPRERWATWHQIEVEFRAAADIQIDGIRPEFLGEWEQLIVEGATTFEDVRRLYNAVSSIGHAKRAALGAREDVLTALGSFPEAK